ncbi:hypothetical protein GCM10027515_26610 [Schumannella luteola]|uniref:Major capsid and protease fusion protein n=1 Tax=Schumannella luteola TaxID=472059 RepID=A0A852YCI2_9MICO|nr:hypothetical protein [Schumannella luteola]NYG99542.1 hypothetical protein [Schumannella luteola]TPX03859.1 hypothetical protein FJ656_15115 [Schumannella luteola]
MTDDTTTLEAGVFSLDEASRTVRGLLVPWGEMTLPEHASAFQFDRGTVKVPSDLSAMRANRNHELTDPVASFKSVEDTEKGLVAVFSIARTPEGDEFIEQKKAGKLTRLSAEVRNIVHRGAKVISSTLTGAAFVPQGAFASAALFALDPVTEAEPESVTEESHSEETFVGPDGKTYRYQRDSETTTETTESGSKTTTVTTVTEETEEEEEADVTVSQTAGESGSAPTALTKADAFGLFRLMSEGRASAEQVERLRETTTTQAGLFALTDIKYSGTGSVAPRNTAPQWVGELWDGVAYQQKVADLFGHENATEMKIGGFRWKTKPTGAQWAGNKSNIPSSSAETEPATADFVLWAGGHDHAIEHRLFNTPNYFESYFAAMAESFAKWQDAKTLTDILATADDIDADDPTGLTIGSGLSALIDGASQVMANDAIPTFALVARDVWKQIAKTPANNVLGYLNAALGLKGEGTLDGFTLRLLPDLSEGEVVVGAREAAKVYDLPGAPIRIEAPDTVKGGIDTNVIGGSGTFIHKADAIVRVSPFALTGGQ